MTSSRSALAACAACALLAVAGCGEDDERAETSTKPSIAERQAQLERNPYDIRCGDLADPVASARMTRIVQYALADDIKVRRLNRLQKGQSIFFAITEICRGKPASYAPAEEAIEGVRRGDYRADLGAP